MLSFTELRMFEDVRISLQGTNHIMYIEMSAPAPDFLHVTALLDNYNNYIFNYSQWSKCKILNQKCLYVSGNDPDEQDKRYIVVGDLDTYTNIEHLQRQRKNKISWNKASEICNKLGGHLPHFTSRNDMDKFIVMLLKSDKLPFIEAIHIGLTHDTGQVS